MLEIEKSIGIGKSMHHDRIRDTQLIGSELKKCAWLLVSSDFQMDPFGGFQMDSMWLKAITENKWMFELDWTLNLFKIEGLEWILVQLSLYCIKTTSLWRNAKIRTVNSVIWPNTHSTAQREHIFKPLMIRLYHRLYHRLIKTPLRPQCVQAFFIQRAGGQSN